MRIDMLTDDEFAALYITKLLEWGVPEDFVKGMICAFKLHFGKVGSAETGGEQVAPELNMTRADDGRPQFLWFGGKYYTIDHPECMDALLKAIREFPTSPRSSQNQTVSSGVEGAREGTSADKSELLPTQLPKEK